MDKLAEVSREVPDLVAESKKGKGNFLREKPLWLLKAFPFNFVGN